MPSNPADPGNDVYWRPLSPQVREVMESTIAIMQSQGAEIVRENLPTEGWIGGPGTEMAVLNRNPESPEFNRAARLPIVFVYELKHDMNISLKLGEGYGDTNPGRYYRLQRRTCRPGAAFRPGHLSRRGSHPR